jgi:hypothetical protein
MPQVAQIMILITNHRIKPMVPSPAILYFTLFNQATNFSMLVLFFKNYIEGMKNTGKESKKGQQ